MSEFNHYICRNQNNASGNTSRIFSLSFEQIQVEFCLLLFHIKNPNTLREIQHISARLVSPYSLGIFTKTMWRAMHGSLLFIIFKYRASSEVQFISTDS